MLYIFIYMHVCIEVNVCIIYYKIKICFKKMYKNIFTIAHWNIEG